MQHRRTDRHGEAIIICGTGIVGLACALGLRRAGFEVTLLGPRRELPPARPDVHGLRVYALSPASRGFLEELGVWDTMDPARIVPVDAMEVEGDAHGRVELHAWQAIQPSLAWILESEELERNLRKAVQIYGIPWREDQFLGLRDKTVLTQGGSALEADLLVGADGAGSPVRRAGGLRHRTRPYGATGLVAHFNCERPHQHIALQWFTGDSVLALLPMPDTQDGHQVSAVWSLPQARADELLGMDAAARRRILEAELRQISGGRLGALSLRTAVAGFPLSLDRGDMVGHHIALVGDAAHRIHPLAGQGLNLGLGDARELVRILRDKEDYRHVGDERLLRRYARARAEPVLAMQLATDGLFRLFGQTSAPIAWARNAGMSLVDAVPLIKQRLISRASGEEVKVRAWH